MKLKLMMIVLATAFSISVMGQKSSSSVLSQMEWLHENKQINFIYDSSLPVNGIYSGPPIAGMKLDTALKHLFANTGISYETNGNYVMLRDSRTPKRASSATAKNEKHHTISGYIRNESGESLINATIYDLSTKQGTMSNEYGFFSLTLPEGNRKLRISYVGHADRIESLTLKSDRIININLSESASLGEVIVIGDMNAPLLNTQTGKRSLSANDIKPEFSLLSSPDIVKVLQRTSGVAEGIELASGLYVHGGNNDENLYLIDGTPLYQVNHSMGLFSSFNPDVVKNVDFYKSGFPARYGGRLSSVVDVRTKDGDMNKLHGAYRIGLLDGSFQLEGPLQKDKTSFNLGFRRSWIDLFSRPIFAIANHGDDEEKLSINYFFHDINAKITHVFSQRSKAYLSLYSGTDRLNAKDEYRYYSYENEKQTLNSTDIDRTKFSWGNLNVALNWNYVFSSKLFSNFTAVYTHNSSKLYTLLDERYNTNSDTPKINHSEHGYNSSIYDMGYRTAFDYRPNPKHHIRFGHDYTFHRFCPQTSRRQNYYTDELGSDTVTIRNSNRHTSHELNLYAEDEFRINTKWSVNAGINISMFGISHKSFIRTDPRLALQHRISSRLSAKISYTMMTQFVHKISNSFIDMPTDYWVPTTSRLQPMRSRQFAAGLYAQPNNQWQFSLEGYYKLSDHLLQYSNWSGIEPPASHWDLNVMEGKGRFYGIEADAHYNGKRINIEGSYTLSWNRRKFDNFYDGWYYDKFDNRHKINLCARWNMSKKVSAFAAWSYHSGNRTTVPTQYIPAPSVPGNKDFGYAYFAYEKPNNLVLPAYHRMDIGLDFHHTTKHGHERIWNLSVYNAYCHLNTMWTKVQQRTDGTFFFKTKSIIPIIPSFSYTIKF